MIGMIADCNGIRKHKWGDFGGGLWAENNEFGGETRVAEISGAELAVEVVAPAPQETRGIDGEGVSVAGSY